MDEKRSFALLGIGQTKDENAIRQAYYDRLPEFNPEDDPEGFRRLRTAYEEAIAYARAVEEEAEAEEDETPSGQFVKKATRLYASMEGRQDAEAWRELFFDEAFLDLEEEENCREKLLVFLMQHYYFPTGVWKVLDERLRIREGREELCEKFPRDFVDYIARKAAQGEDFPFEQLTGPDDADVDQFLMLFSQANGQEAKKEDAALEKTLILARETGISHPDMEMNRARLCLRRKREGEGRQIVEGLLKGPFCRAQNVLYQCAEFFWEAGERERAAALYETLKEDSPRHYMANFRLAEIYADQDEPEKAKRCVNTLLSYPIGEEGEQLADRVNAQLEKKLRGRLQEDPDDFKARMELGWCLLQTDRGKETIAMMEALAPAPEEEKDYCNLMGKAYFYAERYEEAETLLRRWEELLRKGLEGVDLTAPDLTEEQRSEKERICTAHSMLAQIFAERAEQKEGAERDRDFEEALREIGEAQRVEDQEGFKYTKGQFLFQWGHYEECIALMEEMEKDYPEFAPAFILHQRASAKRYDGAGVIRCHGVLRRIAPNYSGTWENAAEVWFQTEREEALAELLKDARENGVDTGRLRQYEFFQAARSAETKAELSDVIAKASEIVLTWEEEEWEPEEKGNFSSEMARSLWRLEKYGEAKEWIGRALELEPGNTSYLYIRAGILKDEGHYEGALGIYEACRNDYDETPHFYANIGECLYEMGKYEKALPVLQKAVDMRENDPRSCWYIVQCLKRQFEEDEDLEKLRAGIHYANLIIEYGYASQGFVEKGHFYVLMGSYESARAEFQRAVEKDPENPFAYSNLSRMQRLTGYFDKMVETAKKAVELSENDPSPFHHQMLAKAYLAKHCYPEALETLKELWRRYINMQTAYLDDMVNALLLNGRWQEALECVQNKSGELERMDYEEKIIDIYLHTERYEEAVKYVKRYYRAAGFSVSEVAEALADIRWYSGELKEAAKLIDSAAAGMTKEDSRYDDVCYKAARIWFYLGNRERAKEYALRALAYYEEKYGIEKYMESMKSRPWHVYQIAVLKLYAGETEEARMLAGRMKALPLCLGCKFKICTDAMELEAGVLETLGETETAAALYERILEESRGDMDVRMKLARLKKTGKRPFFGKKR